MGWTLGEVRDLDADDHDGVVRWLEKTARKADDPVRDELERIEAGLMTDTEDGTDGADR